MFNQLLIFAIGGLEPDYMAKFINPFTDFGFKKIFGQEVNKDLLIDFLNSLLVGERHILDIEFLNKERNGRSSADRALIYDIYCLTDSGEYIIVEMQNRKQDNFIDRMLFYTSRSIAEQGEKGPMWQYDIKAVYGVAFMNFEDASLHKFRTDAVITNRETGEVVSNKLRMIFLQLPLFIKSEPEECSSDFERWIYILKNMDTLDRMPYAAKSAVFKKLSSIASLAELTPAERRKYDHAIKVMRDNYTFEVEAKKHLEEALQKGMAEGRVQGREEGRKEGLQKGKAEGKKEAIRQMVKNMLENGMSIDTISACTGIDANTLNNILNED